MTIVSENYPPLPVHPWTISPGLPRHPSPEEIPIGGGEQIVDPISAGLALILLPNWMVVVVRRLRALLGQMPVVMVLVKMSVEMHMVLMQTVIDVVQPLTEAEKESGMGVVGVCTVTRVRFGTVTLGVQRGGQWRQGPILGRSTRLPDSCVSAIQCSLVPVIKWR